MGDAENGKGMCYIMRQAAVSVRGGGGGVGGARRACKTGRCTHVTFKKIKNKRYYCLQVT